MKTFKEFVKKQDKEPINEASKAEMRKWIFDKLENSDMDSEETEKQFIKKFGKNNMKVYQDALSEFLD